MATHRIARGDVEAVLSPERGGSVLSLRVGGVDLLRPTPAHVAEDPRGPLETACFPLVPYTNRIAAGRFDFGGRRCQLPLNFGDHPHSLHGFGWTSPWQVEDTGEDHVVLSHERRGDGAWPWAYRAQQRARVTDNGIVLSLSVENTSDEGMPAGLGLHPYFPSPPGTHLRFQSQGVWLSTPDLLPERLAPAETLGDWSAGRPVAGEALIDHCYGEWDGRATVALASGQELRMTARGAPFLHVYRPPDQAFFCLEPVTHMPDAINRPKGMDVLRPGCTLELEMTLALA
ncbi:aldose 1-epimerase [Novosphingobium soli]|uniref:Aldose 1-epimerase n=1 Tax=Novosphingobium soli TaxID=574956 RepID=A0ABV6CZ88_9SPHN